MEVKEKLLQEQKKQLEIFNALQPETFQLLHIPIDDLFKAIRVVHPRAYPVFRSLIKAYPKDHFRSCMQEAVGMELISHETKR